MTPSLGPRHEWAHPGPAVTEADVAIKFEGKADIIQEFQQGESDTGSTPVQVAMLTHRIRHLTEHLKQFPKDHSTRRGLLRLVGRRGALLRYYSHRHPGEYKALIQRLGLRR